VKLKDLAGDLGVTVDQLKAVTGKEKADAVLTEGEIEKAVEALTSDKSDGPENAPDDVVRFWSMVKNHAFMVPDAKNEESTLMRFDDYLLPVRKGSPAYKALVALADPEIMVIRDEGFDDVGKAKQFRQLLEDKAITGPSREPSVIRGLAFILALFRTQERDLAATTLQAHGMSGLIELAVRKKSYIAVGDL